MTTQQQRELGRKIYNEALYDRRGFRPDQMGIEDEDTWDEIYEAIGQAAQAQQEAPQPDGALTATWMDGYHRGVSERSPQQVPERKLLQEIVNMWDGPLYRHEMAPLIEKSRALLTTPNKKDT